MHGGDAGVNEERGAPFRVPPLSARGICVRHTCLLAQPWDKTGT